MATDELDCSRKYHNGWRKQIQLRLDVTRQTDHLLEVTTARELDVTHTLARELKRIEGKRARLNDRLEAQLRRCQALQRGQAACRRRAQETFEAGMERLRHEEADAQREAADIREVIRRMNGAALRHREQVLAGVAAELDSLATELAACAEAALGSNDVSGTPAFGSPSEIIPTLAFAGPDQANAAKFYREWKIPTTDVRSLKQVIDALAAATGPIKRIRLTCHAGAKPPHMRLGMFKATSKRRPLGRADVVTAIQIDRLADGDCAYFRLILFDGVPPTLPVVDKLDPSAAYFTTLRLNRPTPRLTELMSWLYITNRGVRSLTVEPARFGPAKTDLLRAARLAADDLKRIAAKSLDANALDELDNAIRTVIENEHGVACLLKFGTPKAAVTRAQMTKSAVVGLDSGFRDTLAVAKQNLTSQTSLDLRGCLLAYMGNAFPAAMAKLLSLDPARVSAPRWFHIAMKPRPTPLEAFQRKPTTQVSLECQDDFKRAASDKLVQAFHRRWLDEFGLDAEPGTDFDKLFRYCRDVSTVLPLIDVKGNVLQHKSKGDVILSLGFRCAPDEDSLREAMRIWLRSLWLDAPEASVSTLTDAWIAGRAPYFEALVDDVDKFVLKTTGVAFPMSPSYSSAFRRGS